VNKLSIVFPVYNEKATILQIVSAVEASSEPKMTGTTVENKGKNPVGGIRDPNINAHGDGEIGSGISLMPCRIHRDNRYGPI